MRPIDQLAQPFKLDAIEFARDPVGYLQAVHDAHGDLAACQDGHRQMVFAFGQDYNQHLLTRTDTFHSNLFTVPGPRNSALRRIGLGLITMNGEAHKRHRRLVMPCFHKSAIEGYADAVTGATRHMLERWRPGQVRDIFQEMQSLTMHVTSKVIFGLDDLDAAERVGGTMERVLDLSTELGISGLFPAGENAGIYDELVAVAERSEANVVEMIARKRSTGALGNDVLSTLIRAHDADGTGMSDGDLIGHASILFGAAHRTTASALTWTLFLLAQHPAVMARLFEELHATLGREAPQPGQLACLSLLERVVKESMRLLPPVVFNTRTATQAAQLGPIALRRGATVVFSHYVTHHMAELYPQPNHFLPDRWLNSSPSPYAYLPFSAGPRMCIGAAMAVMVIKTVLAMTLQRYRLAVESGATINRNVSVTLMPAEGMPMLVCRPDRQFSSSEVFGNIHEMVALEAARQQTRRLAA